MTHYLSCRNCLHRRKTPEAVPSCGNPESEFYGGPVCLDGYCPRWSAEVAEVYGPREMTPAEQRDIRHHWQHGGKFVVPKRPTVGPVIRGVDAAAPGGDITVEMRVGPTVIVNNHERGPSTVTAKRIERELATRLARAQERLLKEAWGAVDLDLAATGPALPPPGDDN